MANQDIVEANLRRLKEISKGELTREVVQELTGMSYGTLWVRTNHGRNFTNKSVVRALIRQNRPVLENWPRTPQLEGRLGIRRGTANYWYRNKKIRKRIGAVKLVGKTRFNPDWVDQVENQMQQYGGKDEFIDIYEASNILEIPPEDIGGWKKVLVFLQPAGPGTMRLYPRKNVLLLKQKLDEISAKDYLTSEQVSTELDALEEDVRDKVSHAAVHPITGHLTYDPTVLEDYKDALFVRCSRAAQVLRYCERHYVKDPTLRGKIEQLFVHKKIPVERGDNRTLYLDRESEAMVRNIYGHTKMLREEGIRLLLISEAASKLRMSHHSLLDLVGDYGVEYLMTSAEPLTYELSTERCGRKIIPRVPYVRYAQRSVIHLATPTVASLRRHMGIVKRQAEDPSPKFPYGRFWRKRLAQSIDSLAI